MIGTMNWKIVNLCKIRVIFLVVFVKLSRNAI